MCDAAGQAAHALEPLRRVQARLELAALGDVSDERDVEVGQEVGSGGDLDLPRRPVVPPDLVLVDDRALETNCCHAWSTYWRRSTAM